MGRQAPAHLFFRQETLRMIRTVVSDLGNVLLHFDHMRACHGIGRMSQWSPQEIYDSMFGSNLVRDYEGQKVAFCCAGCPAAWDQLSDADKQAKLKKASRETQHGQR